MRDIDNVIEERRGKIGFFDSGIGGLTILHAVRSHLPEYDYLYYGDTAHVPYGDKPETLIRKLTTRGIIYLFDKGAELVVVACNTASAETLPLLQIALQDESAYGNKKVLGVIIPTIETLIESNARHALLIGTTRTVDSQKYNKELEKRNAHDIVLSSQATPSLVPLIEAGCYEKAAKVAIEMIDQMDTRPERVILGCTHYTLIKDELRKRYGRQAILAQDEIIPDKLSAYLTKHREIEIKLSKNASLEIHLSRETRAYREQISLLFQTLARRAGGG